MPAILHGGDPPPTHLSPPWLDLSTGINPHPFPFQPSPEAFTALPRGGDLAALLDAARAYYRVPAHTGIVAAPGTQAILQWLPFLIPARTVAVATPTYAEHAASWSRHADVQDWNLAAPPAADVAVIVNPNNPDGRLVPPDRLAALTRFTPLLVVDEAFGDLTPNASMVGRPNTLVLKSFGKFFGLAGVRLGFAIGHPDLTERLAEALGPWAVSGPALEVGTAALSDPTWAEVMRIRLGLEASVLDQALAGAGLKVVGGTSLFRLVDDPEAHAVHDTLARDGVWTRRFTNPRWLRFGLPGTRSDELLAALAPLVQQQNTATAGAAPVSTDPPTPDEPFEIPIGRERRPLRLTFGEYQRWLANIRADSGLIADLAAVRSGARRYLDLNEGDAGTFPEQIHPDVEQIAAKLDWRAPGDRHVLVAFLKFRIVRSVLGPQAGDE